MTQGSVPRGSRIEGLLAEPGQSWSPEDKEYFLEWLLGRDDPYRLKRYAREFLRKGWRGISVEEGAEIFSTFLAGPIDRVLSRYDPQEGEIKSYLRTCLRNHCHAEAAKFWRRKRKEMSLLSTEGNDALLQAWDTSLEGDPARCLEHKIFEGYLGRALAELSDQDREILLMSSDEKSYDAIAEELGVTLSVVKNRLHRARQRLRSKLVHLR
jgi:RNA polymerase sigma-70 factor (ECF subfamily)